MPSQRTGIGNEEPVQLVTVDIDTAEITSEPIDNFHDVNSNSNNRFVSVNKAVNHNKSQEINKLGNLEGVLGEEDSTADSLLGNSEEDLQNVTTTAITLTPVSESVTTSEVFNSNSITTTQSLKRQLSSTSNPVVHKVFITKNPSTSQPQTVPVQLNQLGQVQIQTGQTISVSSMASGGISLLPQGAQTPTKTITISPQGILSPGKQVYTTLATTPTRLAGMTVNKIPISPAKTPTKITMIPVTVGKSPQRSLVPASSTVLSKSLSDTTTISPLTLTQNAMSGGRQTLITMSPSKVIKQGTVIQHRPLQIQPTQQKPILVQQPGVKQTVQIPLSTVHTIQGSKFQYVRLVTPSSQTVVTTTKTGPTMTSLVQAKSIAPAVTTGNVGAQQITKITLPVAGTTQLVAPKASTTAQPVQRILLPAGSNQVTLRTSGSAALTTGTTLAQIRPSLPASGVSSLPPGTTILSSGGSSGGLQGFALVPASYVAQLQQQMQATTQPTVVQQQSQPVSAQAQTVQQQQQQRQEFVPIASSDPLYSANAMSRNNVNGSAIEPTGARPRKPCNCTKSQCLKLYCDCFANGEFCHNCNCNNCANNLEHEEERSRAIKSCLDRNPLAFHPKIGKGKDGERDRRHNKGCNCKRSGCLKNYCECYEAKIMCSSSCKCIGCKNFEESPERKTLMHLADAAEVRVQQQTAIKSKLSSQISGIPSRPPVSSASGERLPYTFITTEVAEATCACLLAQAEESERLKMPPVVQERMVIEEFGRCLMQIIDSANKSRDTSDT